MASKTESPEFEAVRGKYTNICECIFGPDAVKFSGELLQLKLISDVSHEAAIAVTGLSPSNKVAHLVSEAMNNVSNSPDNFYKFVSILESRNTQLASSLRSDYLKHYGSGGTSTATLVMLPDFCVSFVSSLQEAYRTGQSPTWDPLPQCQYVKLAMIKEKGKRYGSDKMVAQAESRVEGDVDKMLTVKVPVDSDAIFDDETFKSKCKVILVEGVGGMGKTSLAYRYAQKWAEGKLSTFDAVALVHLRDLNEKDVHDVDCILPHFLSLASGNSISKEMARLIVDTQKILLILDGWDEAPASIRTASFLKSLLRSVSPKTRILITSRPDFSVELHSLANRVEILGFTKSDIHDYFENALSSQLPDIEVKSACDKLSSHFHRYPVIESCCYVPLNAAILAYIYINHDQTLPVTRCELFQELVLCCMVRELETRQPDRVLDGVFSFEDFPDDLKEQLHRLSELAFNGVMQNKIVFTRKELASLSTLGLLHSVQGFGSIGRKLITYNFNHLAIQELLAAYYITQLEPAEHSALFETLLNDKLKFPVLQFYAGLTGLTNESVRNLVTGFNFDSSNEKSCLSVLALLNCIFEAQIDDQLFLEQMVHTLKFEMRFFQITLSPIDCQAINYFLSSIKTLVRGQMSLCISTNVDDLRLGMLLGISNELDQTADGVLCSLKELDVIYNDNTDAGVLYIAKALVSNSTIARLHVGSEIITDMGLVPLLEVLPRQNSLEQLDLYWELSNPEVLLKKIGECVGKSSTLNELELYPSPSELPSEEALKEWIQSFIVGGDSLIHSLEHCKVEWLYIGLVWQEMSFSVDKDDVDAQLCSHFQETIKFVNSKRKTSQTARINFDILHYADY